jgi:hypothetical protein
MGVPQNLPFEKEKAFNAPNSVAYGKDNSQKRKKSAPRVPHPSQSHRERVPVSALARRGGEGWDAPLRYPLLPLLPGKAGLQGLRHHSLEQRPRVTPLTGPKARAKCLIRHSQLHESKSFSIEDIFLSLFSAQKIASSPKTLQVTHPQ